MQSRHVAEVAIVQDFMLAQQGAATVAQLWLEEGKCMQLHLGTG